MLLEPGGRRAAGSPDGPASDQTDPGTTSSGRTPRPVGRIAGTLLDPRSVSRQRLRRLTPPRWVGRTLLLYVASRALVGLAVVMAIGIAVPPDPHEWLERWDSFWYLEIARHGYPDVIAPLSPERPYSPWAFFPLWPMLVRGFGALLGGHPVLAAYLLNFVLGGVLALLVRKLFATVADARTADVGVLLFVFFPGTNVFSAAYSEPLALCLAAGTLLALLSRYWALAGILAAFAGAARPPVAAAVFAALVWAVLMAMRNRQWRSIVAIPLAPLGIVAFALYGWYRTGQPFAWHEAEKLFGNVTDFGRSFATDVTRAFLSDVREPATGLAVLVWVSIAVLLVLAVFFVLRPPPGLLVAYTLVAVALPATSSALMPKIRFLAAAFPLLLPLAGYLARRRSELVVGVVVGAEGAMLGGFTMMHLLGRLAFP